MGRHWGLELVMALVGLSLALIFLGAMWALLVLTWPLSRAIDWWKGDDLW